jgi:hypothetical protein
MTEDEMHKASYELSKKIEPLLIGQYDGVVFNTLASILIHVIPFFGKDCDTNEGIKKLIKELETNITN